MAHDPEKINELYQRLSELLDRQNTLRADLLQVQQELSRLSPDTPSTDDPDIELEPVFEEEDELVPDPLPRPEPVPAPERAERKTLLSRLSSAADRSSMEKFIGENLISKIGILITVFGVAFGAKYVIDRELISPMVRIMLGYLAGGALVFFAMRLKATYTAFSAVLLSGGLAIWYIITYFAYAYYELIPQAVAFGLMVLFTLFSVLAALRYDRQIIALFGLVGAYAVPFLLGSGSGQVEVLFTYMVIINIGLLWIAFRKEWRLVNRAAFWVTWLIYSWWWITGYQYNTSFATGMLFLSLFFVIFYLTILAYQLIRQEPFRNRDIFYLLVNSFIFYGFGYGLLESEAGGETWLGPFTLINAIIHFGAGLIIYRYRLADRRLFYFVIGLVLVFITIAIPVQLDGDWVTLLWVGEAVLLYWLARSRQTVVFERMAIALMVLAMISLLEDWSSAYRSYYFVDEFRFMPILNVHFLSSLLFVAAFAILNWLRHGNRYSQPEQKSFLQQVTYFALPAVLIITLYFTFLLEIDYYWQQRYLSSEVLLPATDPTQAPTTARNEAWYMMRTISTALYTLFFATLLSWANLRWLRHRMLGWINIGLNILALLGFLTAGLFALSELREYYLAQPASAIGLSFAYVTGMRYLSYVFVAGLLYTTYRYLKDHLMDLQASWPFDTLLHITLLWTLSSELLHWMDVFDYAQSYKLGLSIFWGVYALLLIVLGIARRKAYLRVGAIVLFAITLIKLFFYDIAHLNTISKTVVLISLGLLLLIISFLYNKFKHLITDENI